MHYENRNTGRKSKIHYSNVCWNTYTVICEDSYHKWETIFLGLFFATAHPNHRVSAERVHMIQSADQPDIQHKDINISRHKNSEQEVVVNQWSKQAISLR